MNRRSLLALIVLNLALLAGVFLAGPAAPAQAQGLGRARQFIMVAGQPLGRQEKAVYIIETGTSRMVAVIYRAGDKTVEVVGSRNLGRDLRPRDDDDDDDNDNDNDNDDNDNDEDDEEDEDDD